MATQVLQKHRHSLILHFTELPSNLELKLTQFGNKSNLDFVNGRVEIFEWNRYEYVFSLPEYSFKIIEDAENIIIPSPSDKHRGLIEPKSFVGSASIEILKNGKPTGIFVEFEIKSYKIDYQDEYRSMLNKIAEKTAELILKAGSPVSNTFEIDPNTDAQTLYQRFAFVKSLIDSREFDAAIGRILSAPKTGWVTTDIDLPISRIRRLKHKDLQKIVNSSKHIPLPQNHPLRAKYHITSVAQHISTQLKTDTVDIPENRFVKHVLESFAAYIYQIATHPKADRRTQSEANEALERIETILQNPFFREVSSPQVLKLNSPVLQRKEGYREILKSWLLFDLSAKLVWQGGDEVYKAGKKDVAVLYEYWVFFKMLEIIASIFQFDKNELQKLITPQKEGLGLTLKRGKTYCIDGIFDGRRKLRVKFCYNRTFSAAKREYPNPGSWTLPMRPDYTLSIWPYELAEDESEEKELMTHIHFDAKYRIDFLRDFSDLPPEEDDENSSAERERTVKRDDIIKMHAYKDAIRRTAGAYIIYPGNKDYKVYKGFHELIPGLGAFPLRPVNSQADENEIKKFILQVINEIFLRTSQYEKTAVNTYQIHKDSPLDLKHTPEEKNPPILDPENGLPIFPDETYVIVGYARQFEWVKANRIYNLRIGDVQGSVKLTEGLIKAEFIVVIHSDDFVIFKITQPATIQTKSFLESKGYKDPRVDFYIVFENLNPSVLKIDKQKLSRLIAEQWRSPYNKSAFTVKLSSLM